MARTKKYRLQGERSEPYNRTTSDGLEDVNRAAVSSYKRSEVGCTLKTEQRMMMKCYEKATVRKQFFRVKVQF